MNPLKAIRNRIRYGIYRVYPKKALYDRFRWTYGRKPDLKDPKTFDEKLIWLMINRYADDERVIRLVDKGEIHNYYREKGMEDILNEMYGLFRSPDEIPWETLPDSFVLKCTHGAGYNIFVKDKNSADRGEISRQLTAWQKETYGTEFGGIQYRKLRHDIICERFLDTPDGKPPVDYKFYCFDGRLECIEIIMDRFENYHYILVDRDFKPLPFGKDAIRDEKFIESSKPVIYEAMRDLAELLSKEFPFVRVDIYDRTDRPMLGEMTFFPMDGINEFFGQEGQLYLGEKLKL